MLREETGACTSWTWRSCEQNDCLTFVYADSMSSVSAPGYRFTENPDIVATFRKSFERIADLDCDILLAPHPEFVRLREKRAQVLERPDTNPFLDRTACKAYAVRAADRLEKRLKSELEN